jgi:hypothetical protein
LTTEEHLGTYGFVPADEDLPAIRALLDRELTARGEGTAVDDLALLCCVQLFSRGHFEDIGRIWAAKNTDFDFDCMIEAHLLCGAGVDATKAHLKAQSDPELLAALANIEAWGDELDDFEPSSHLEFYRGYFQTDSESVSQTPVTESYRSARRRFFEYCVGFLRRRR